jgi:hypothetical protein
VKSSKNNGIGFFKYCYTKAVFFIAFSDKMNLNQLDFAGKSTYCAEIIFFLFQFS